MNSASDGIDALVQAEPGAADTGADLRFSPVWSEVLDARGSEDGLEKGIWAVEGGPADWTAVAQLISSILREQSKDLRLAAWYAEARVRLAGFPGAVESCQLIRRLLETYGARLHPRGDELDHVPFVRGILLFDRSLAGALRLAPMLEGDSVRRGFSMAEFDSAGAEQATVDAATTVTPERIRGALESVEICSAELATGAVAAGTVSPCNFNRSLAALDAWRSALLSVQHRARKSVEGVRSDPAVATMPVEAPQAAASSALVQMSMAAPARHPDPAVTVVELWGDGAGEPSGRGRFYQKLAAVDVCIKSGTYRSARVLLSELLELIDRWHLQEWEPRWATTAVYRNYLQLLGSVPSESGDVELAKQLFERWVRFDPRAAMEFEGMAADNGSGPLKP
jgi:type VI secretion system ImpA family protein